jgi:3'-5' exoribonuclease
VGKDQFEISAIERLSEEEAKSIDVSEYIITAPEPSEEMFAFLLARAEALGDEKLRAFAVDILKENKESLLYYPAAMSNHHAYYGGLLYHTKRMLMLAEGVAGVYSEIDADLLAVGVLVHDIGKLSEMKANRYGVVGSYTPEGNMLTHITLGILYVSEKAKAIGLPEETRLMIEHMILSHHYLPEFGSPVMPAFPEAEALHHIDNLDASVTFMSKELGPVHGGSMSEWIRGLEGRKLYKKK